jgi:hypothetical protein
MVKDERSCWGVDYQTGAVHEHHQYVSRVSLYVILLQIT